MKRLIFALLIFLAPQMLLAQTDEVTPSYTMLRDSSGRLIYGFGKLPLVYGHSIPVGTPFFDSTTQQMYYWTGSAWSVSGVPLTGGTLTGPIAVQLSEPTPSAPVLALAGAGAGNVDNGVHRCKTVAVTASGKTAPSAASNALTVVDKGTDGQVAITLIAYGSSDVTSREVYCTTAGGGTYYLAATIANNSTTTATFNLSDATLLAAAVAPTSNTTSDTKYSLTATGLGFDLPQRNTAWGSNTLPLNTSGVANAAFGFEALYQNTTGYNNAAHGAGALRLNTEGYANTAVGFHALTSNTTGWDNTAVGISAMDSNTQGFYNSAVGGNALAHNTTGYHNSVLGEYAMYDNTEGFYNAGVGRHVLGENTTGSLNSGLGQEAGAPLGTGAFGVTTGASNTFVGAQSGFSTADQRTNSTALGYRALITADNQIALGNSSVTKLLLSGTTTLEYEAANTWGIKNGANPQTINLYGTTDGAGNYERLRIGMAADHVELYGEQGGTGGEVYIAMKPQGASIAWIFQNDYVYPSSTDAGFLGSPSYPVRSLYNARSIQGSKSKALTDATATAFVRLSVADDDYEGCHVIYTAYAEDTATDARQTRTGGVYVAITNNSGTEAAVFSTGDSAVSVTAGTFTCTFDGNSASANTIDLRASCDTSLAATTTLTFEYRLDCPSTVTVTPL